MAMKMGDDNQPDLRAIDVTCWLCKRKSVCGAGIRNRPLIYARASVFTVSGKPANDVEFGRLRNSL